MKQFFKTLGEKLNLSKQCHALNVGLWSCPQFLFLVMGVIIIGAIIVTYFTAQQYTDAQIVALIVIVLTAFLFVVSYVIVSAFEKVVQARRMEAKHAQELLELKDQFVFIAAHELKTPAVAIQKNMQKFEAKHQHVFETEKSIVHNIKESNQRLLALVQDLLQVARIEGKTIHIALSSVSVIEAYEVAKKELETLASNRGVVITESIPDDVPLVRADKRRLKEIFVNFLSNAIKYSDQKNGKVSFRIVHKEAEVVMSVSNNGPQISKEDQKHVFQKFWRSKEARKSITEGTGLGLFIVKQLAELMEGRVRFTSELDKTVFYVALKADLSEEKQNLA